MLDDLQRLHGDPEVARYFSRGGQPESRKRVEERLAEWADLFARRRLGKLRVTDKKTGELLGRAGFGIYGADGDAGDRLCASCGTIGAGAMPAKRRRRCATGSSARRRAIIFIGFADARNAASIAVLRKIGMTPTGTHDFEGVPCAIPHLPAGGLAWLRP